MLQDAVPQKDAQTQEEKKLKENRTLLHIKRQLKCQGHILRNEGLANLTHTRWNQEGSSYITSSCKWMAGQWLNGILRAYTCLEPQKTDSYDCHCPERTQQIQEEMIQVLDEFVFCFFFSDFIYPSSLFFMLVGIKLILFSPVPPSFNSYKIISFFRFCEVLIIWFLAYIFLLLP